MNWDMMTEKEILRYAEPETPLERRLMQLLNNGESNTSALEQEIEELELGLERANELENEVAALLKTIRLLRKKMDEHKIDHSGIE